MKAIRKRLGTLTTKKAEHLARISKLEEAKLRHDETEAKKKISTRAAELTAPQQDRLLNLIYVTHAPKFEEKAAYKLRMWRPSFTYFEEHEVGSKAFTVPSPQEAQ